MFQALSEELSKKASALVLENKNLKKVWCYSIFITFSVFLLHFLPSSSFCCAHLCEFSILRYYRFSINFYLFNVFLIIRLIQFCCIFGEKEKELALKEYQSLETTNKLLKAQVRYFSMEEIFKSFVCINKSIQENWHLLHFADTQVNKDWSGANSCWAGVTWGPGNTGVRQ